MGWFSPALPVLLSEQTPLITGPMTNEELSTFGATSSIGALVGAFFYGYLSSKMGCKFSMTWYENKQKKYNWYEGELKI